MSDAAEFRTVALDDPAVRTLLADYHRELSATGVVINAGAPGGTAPDQFRPPHGRYLVVLRDGRAVGCGGVRLLGDRVAEVKRMYVAPAARGSGLARQLLDRLEGAARELGASVVRLDTSPHLAAATGLYRSAGYREIADYNGNPDAGWWGEKTLS